MMRPHAVQDFIFALRGAVCARAGLPEEQAMLSQAFDALSRPGHRGPSVGGRLPACRHLGTIASTSQGYPVGLHRLLQTFFAIEPMLRWKKRTGSMQGASQSFLDGHANALIVGAGGLERRSDVSIGATILAPRVRYPDHTHPPEETYLVLSQGFFGNDRCAAIEPGVGGVFYNAPGIVHSMQAGNEPLFAFWILWAGDGGRTM